MEKIVEKVEGLLEIGGTKKDIAFLIISAIALLCDILKVPLPFDSAWIAIILCGVPIILEAIIGLVTAFDIKADVLVSMALIASVCIKENFTAGEVAFIMQLGGLLEELTVAKAREGIEKLVHLTPRTARVVNGSEEKIIPAEEVRQGIVVSTLYIATISPTIGKASCDSPSTIVEATAISVHATERVVAVGGSYRSVVAYLHASGTEIIVIATSHSRHGVVVSLERKGKVNVAGEAVQTADVGESELSAFHVVDWSTIDIDIIVLLVERTVTETHR